MYKYLPFGLYVLLFLFVLSVFTSCSSYEVIHYNRNEIDKKIGSNIAKYDVYIHDKGNTYKVGNPSLSPAGVKGDLTPVTDRVTIAEIKNPHTRRQFKRHLQDLSIYTQAEISEDKNDVVLKKEAITGFSLIALHTAADNSVDFENIAGTTFAVGLNIVIWVGIVYAFEGKL
jgi:hypothetical protein